MFSVCRRIRPKQNFYLVVPTSWVPEDRETGMSKSKKLVLRNDDDGTINGDNGSGAWL